jgi:hypothetical protein
MDGVQPGELKLFIDGMPPGLKFCDMGAHCCQNKQMIDLTLHDSGPRSLRVREFYLGRQPILDRNQALFGYELLFRNAPVGPAHITNDLTATAAVIAHASQLGMEKTIGDARLRQCRCRASS